MLEATLLKTVRSARRAPFYKDHLPKARTRFDLCWWRSLPLTTKDHLRDAYPFGLLATDRANIATYHESSGTTGTPTASYFTDGDWDDVASRFARNAVGLAPGDCVLVKTPYSMVTTAHQMHRAARLCGATVIPADNRSAMMPYSKVVQLLRDLPVTVAWCLPTEVLLWAAAARVAGLDPARDFPHLRAFLVAGEPLSPAKRRRLSEVWGGKAVHQDYGSTETGSLAGECRDGRLHLWTDRLYCEVYDEATRRFATEGVGQLVVTTLYREAMPLVRYLLEDTVEIEPPGSCSCGSELPVVRVRGREASRIRVQGVDVFPLDLEETVYSLPLAYGVMFWRACYDRDGLKVEIEPEPAQAEIACDELAHEIYRSLKVNAVVTAPQSEPLVPRHVLTDKQRFSKPRFLFRANEDWKSGLNYW